MKLLKKLKMLAGKKKHTDTQIAGRTQTDTKVEHIGTSSPTSSSETDDSDDIIDELPEHVASKIQETQKRGRHSVSAEVYGEWNKKLDFKAPVHPKTDEQAARIRSVLLQSFMFQHLDESDLQTVLLAFTEKTLKSNDVLIKQGDDGDSLFLIEKGEVDVFKLLPGETEAKHMCVMVAGDAVGELALLYNVSRAATVIAKTDVVLWALDRESFNHIVKDAAARRRELYEEVLKEVKIFESMDPYERNKLSDALKTEMFAPGAVIISEGDSGDKFYIVELGQAEAVKNGKVVLEYERGDYFGELALIRNQPRLATVRAKMNSAVKCISLDRHSFKRLLGPIENILRRQAGRYEEIEAKLAAEHKEL